MAATWTVIALEVWRRWRHHRREKAINKYQAKLREYLEAAELYETERSEYRKR